MTTQNDRKNGDFKKGDQIGGYRVLRAGSIVELAASFYELEHVATGARHFHIANGDQENTFSVAFKTVPKDSTGVAHILEHTALCGSRQYPVRDPFFSMLKRSLSTFMNAFTASDWTMYPYSTENKKDYYNLMGVYLDAAFFPKIESLSFKQEGHRLEVEPDADHPGKERLVIKGVVYNEMKGAMSSPDQVMVRSLMNALYPDTTYHYNSGGDPAVIPRLTHEQLKAFHRGHYHPSNAYFYTYGDLPLEAHLSYISDKVLRHFQRIDPGTTVPPQPRWRHPKTVVYSYPLSKTEDAEKKYQACVAWLMADITDSFEVLVLTVLSQILLGNAASPLRKALIDANLGTALSDGTGFDADNRDTLFVCGLKDIRKEDAKRVETIVFDTLNQLADNGIERELVDSAIHQVEFHRKEVTNTPYPYGIKLLMAFAGCWMHGGDPANILSFDRDLEALRKKLAHKDFLENRLRSRFLENPHRVLFTLAPDQELAEKDAKQVSDELDATYRKMPPETIASLKADAEALEALQETQEDVNCLPTLEIEDIPVDVKCVSPESADGTAVRYSRPTSGVFYFSAAAGLSRLAPEHLLALPFFCHAVSRSGTRSHDYTEMARRIDASTGGLGLGAHARIAYGNSGACVPFVSFNGKCLVRNQTRMFDIIEEVLSEYSFSDTARLKNLLLEYRANLESAIVHNGHRLAISLASRNFTSAGSLSESWHGVHQLQFVKRVTDNLTEEKLKDFSEQLAAIGKTIFTERNMEIALIGEGDAVSGGAECLSEKPTLSHMTCPIHVSEGFGAPEVATNRLVPREGWHTGSSVSFVASVFETVRMSHPDAPALTTISKLLRSLYLHREIREKGGAYGGFALYNPETGLFGFGSYRDPHIVSTLNVYEKASDFITSGHFTDEDIKESVLQVCSEIDKPDPPGPEARKAFYREIIGLTDDIRKHFKAQLLAMTRDRIIRAAETYFAPDRPRAVAVISGEESLKAANLKLGDHPLALHDI